MPSEIPPFADIRARVTQDYQMQQAVALAREAGTNFSVKLTVSMAVGKSFAVRLRRRRLQPQMLPPFSLSTRELPALGDRAELNQVKQAAFSTEVGHVSNFVETGDGGFILFVQSQLPVDQAVMNAELPQFTDSLRRSRENEAFNQWLQIAASRALSDTPVARQRPGSLNRRDRGHQTVVARHARVLGNPRPVRGRTPARARQTRAPADFARR